MKFHKKTKKAILGISLSLGAIMSALPLQAASGSLAQLKTTLNQKMAIYLSQSLGRSPVLFDLSVKSEGAGCERCGSHHFSLKEALRLDRDTVFDTTLSFKNQQPMLSGRVYDAKERDILVQAVTQTFGKPLEVKVETFPYASVGKDYAITRQVADLYVKPQAVAGDNLATQARLGTPLRILQYSADKKFALVRVEDDGYIAWIQRKDLIEGEQGWYQTWLNGRSVLVMTPISKPLSLHMGTRLRLLKDQGASVQAALPDGKPLTLNKADLVISKPSKLPAAEIVLKTAKLYLPKALQGGGTYLWGGTYGKTLDCSGFVQTVYRLNGVYLPRDADQQKGFTQRVGDTLAQIEQLKPGDLVFFSGNRKYPTHVGLYLGNYQFIHSSSKGPYNGVKISTLKGGGEYDQMLQKIYFGGGRITRSL